VNLLMNDYGEKNAACCRQRSAVWQALVVNGAKAVTRGIFGGS